MASRTGRWIAMASIRAEQSAAIQRMLDLNRELGDERAWRDPWKVLVSCMLLNVTCIQQVCTGLRGTVTAVGPLLPARSNGPQSLSRFAPPQGAHGVPCNVSDVSYALPRSSLTLPSHA